MLSNQLCGQLQTNLTVKIKKSIILVGPLKFVHGNMELVFKVRCLN